MHHIGFWKGDRSNRPGNLITLCGKCHTPANHKLSKFLCGWDPKIKSFKPETFMSIVRWKLVNALGCEHTYGHITKSRRIELKLVKSHANDAYCIAGGTDQGRTQQFEVKQVRRNNRGLEYFYDAKYVDMRTGEKEHGQVLFSGRRTRSKTLSGPNLRVYRGAKLSKGHRSIRKVHFAIQPGDIVRYAGKLYESKGIQNKGEYIRLGGLAKPVRTEKVVLHRFAKGLSFSGLKGNSSPTYAFA